MGGAVTGQEHRHRRHVIVMGTRGGVHRHVANSSELDLIVGQLFLDLLAVLQGVEELEFVRGQGHAQLRHEVLFPNAPAVRVMLLDALPRPRMDAGGIFLVRSRAR